MVGLAAGLQALAGCASRYQEPPSSDKNVATVEANSPVWICSIDGREARGFSFTGHKRFRVATGEHRIEVAYSVLERQPLLGWDSRVYLTEVQVRSRGRTPVKFTAEPGHSYYVQPGRIMGRWSPYLTESAEPVFLELGK
jgi:hypothetical protein